MRYALKDSEGNLVTGATDFAPEGFELVGEVPEELDGVKKLKFDVDGTTIVADQVEIDKAVLRLAVQAKEEMGRKYRLLATKILDIIAGHNDGLDSAQIDAMAISNPDALSLLQRNQPFTAKPFIDAIVPDEVIITTEELAHVAEAYVMFAEENPELVPV